MFTPMVAAVVGDTDGVAPGFNLSIDWWRLAFFSQCEYVFDTDGSEESFFYSWTELSVWPLDWLGAGVVVQRTKARGTRTSRRSPAILLGVAYKQRRPHRLRLRPGRERPHGGCGSRPELLSRSLDDRRTPTDRSTTPKKHSLTRL